MRRATASSVRTAESKSPSRACWIPFCSSGSGDAAPCAPSAGSSCVERNESTMQNAAARRFIRASLSSLGKAFLRQVDLQSDGLAGTDGHPLLQGMVIGMLESYRVVALGQPERLHRSRAVA